MSLSNLLIKAVCTLVLLSAIAAAEEFTVGDGNGWTTGYDYDAWAKNKVFEEGDSLIFHYPVGEHNVVKVNETAYANCAIPPAEETDIWMSGNDVIILDRPGKRWFTCSCADEHCEKGQKLSINVQAKAVTASPAPTPGPASSCKGNSGWKLLGWTALFCH